DIGQAVIGRLSGFGRPFFRLAAGPLIAPLGGGDLDRRDAVEGPDFFRNIDASDDGGLGIDDSGIRFYRAMMDPERHLAAAELVRVDISWAGHLLEEAGLAFENRRRTGQAAAR